MADAVNLGQSDELLAANSERDDMHKRGILALAALCMPIALAACGGTQDTAQTAQNLAAARTGFKTHLTQQTRDGTPVPQPPKGVLDLIRYKSPAGQLAAYITPRPAGSGRHPAIIWITGGDSNSIGNLWDKADPENDQTAAAFRDAGIVTMYPSLRGGNDNPGYREGFYGEVDDILAAADYLATQDYVDPQRIYLGGHSTGGTLVLLTAEMSKRFRGIFAFGPVAEASDYGGQFFYADLNDATEVKLRSPIRWLGSVTSPTFVFEGADQGNGDSLDALSAESSNPQLHFFKVPGRTHFSILAPVTTVIARKIIGDAAGKGAVSFNQLELNMAPR